MYLSLKMYVISLAFIASACFASPVLAHSVAVGLGVAGVAAGVVIAKRANLSLDITLVWHRSRAFWLKMHS
jgi:hypothetical protein